MGPGNEANNCYQVTSSGAYNTHADLHENTYTNLICTCFVVANLICRFDVYKLLVAMLTMYIGKYHGVR